RYRLREPLGEGGMGSVWLADQFEPVKREVAVKVIKRGLDSARVLARFEAERQALALMDHPHIARVLDGGTTGRGQPFFVMEVVRGDTLTGFCDARRLGLRERLDLFAQICSAVQHAHQKGVIHRDLKPSNILVEAVDGRPVPKVIDFGLAKAVGGDPLADRSAATAVGTVLGTPPYMAPEQATPGAVDVDTRADVYALGAVLYELLTGTTPIAKERFARLPLDEAMRLVREEEPPTPSRRLSDTRSDERAAPASSVVAPRVRHAPDLDWVVMKAIAKERERRYESASGLAADVRRFLADEPVQARPPTAGYRLRKFVRRNKGQVVAGALVLLALLAGMAGTAIGLLEARRQRDDANDARGREEAQRVEAEKQAAAAAVAAGLAETRAEREKEARAEADRQGRVAAETVRFLTEVLNLGSPQGLFLAGIKPTAQPTVKQALDAAAKLIDTQFRTEPEIELMVRLTVGRTYRRLGEYAAALQHLTRCRELADRHFPGTREVTLLTKRELASTHAARGEFKRAEPLFDEVVRGYEATTGPLSRHTLAARNDLAQMFHTAAEFDRAEELFREVLDAAPKSDEDVGGIVFSASNNLGLLYNTRKRYDLSEPLLTAAVGWAREHQPDHPDAAVAVNNLANVYWGRKQYDKAEPLLNEAYEKLAATHGVAHPTTLTVVNNLAGLYMMRKEYARAEPLMEAAVADCRAKLGLANLTTLSLMHNLAALYLNQDKFDRAEPLFVDALAGLRKHAPADHPVTLSTLYQLGSLYLQRKEYTRAEPLLVQAATGREKKFTAAHPETAAAALRVIAVYDALKQYDRAEPWHRKRAAAAKAARGADSAEYALELSTLGRNLLAQRKYEPAEAVLRECLAVREKKMAGTWAVPYTRSMVGECLTGLGKFDDAERVLTAAYVELKQREKDIPPELRAARLSDVVQRVVALYAAWGKADQAAEWRAKMPREQLPPPRADR
ncbi:MAG: serine/threonine-protein kinase, partial [Gemmataceae bacterium]